MRHLKKAIWPYQITIDGKDFDFLTDIDNWCNKCIGIYNIDWYSYGLNYRSGFIYAFKKEEDVVALKLKWRI